MRHRWQAPVCGVVLLALITVMAYLPTMRGGFIWDDDNYVVQNVSLRSTDGLVDIWTRPGVTPDYYPLTFTSLFIEFQVWGADPVGYHVDNILLHALTAILLWQLLRRLEVPGAWVAAAIFALHPVQVESVAWITERKNVLSGVLALMSFHAWLRFTPLDADRIPWRKTWPWFAASLGLFALAMLAKTVVITLPLVLLLTRWWKRGRLTLNGVGLACVYFLVAAPMVFLGFWTQHHSVGAVGEEFNLSWIERGLVAGRALWFYAGKLAWPTQLAFIYPHWEIDAHAWWQYLFPLAAVTALATLWLARRRIGRGPLAAAACYAAALSPGLGFFNIFWQRYSFVADHMQYLPSACLITLAVAAVIKLGKKWHAASWVGPAAAILVLLILSGLTWAQSGIYCDQETLWRSTIARNPRCWMAYDNLAHLLYDQDHFDQAVEQYNRALAIRPDFLDAHFNLATWLAERQQFDAALTHYNEAVRLRPDSARIRNNLGYVYAQLGRFDEAIEQFHAALKLEPNYPGARENLGMAVAMRSQRQRQNRQTPATTPPDRNP